VATVADGRRVLIAAYSLSGSGGGDLYVRDLAFALMRHGWTPIVYSKQHGRIADELRRATIPVVSQLDAIASPPQVIHGHQVLETLAAITRFPDAPALFVCHDALSWHSIPPLSPRIGAYIAVDDNCRDRMMFEHSIPEAAIHVITNAVDLVRFRQRGPLPAKPARALVFSNGAIENLWVAPIRDACTQRGIRLDVIGYGADRFRENPEDVLQQYDLVFGKARCALEALATGAAVVVCDRAGLAGIVTSANVAELRQLNFGARSLQRGVITKETILAEIDRYDAIDAAAVSRCIRQTASIDLLAGQIIGVYEELLSAPPHATRELDLRAASESLDRVMGPLYAAMTPKYLPLRGMIRKLANIRSFAIPTRLLYRLKRLAGI
jgi:hypothetical protein